MSQSERELLLLRSLTDISFDHITSVQEALASTIHEIQASSQGNNSSKSKLIESYQRLSIVCNNIKDTEALFKGRLSSNLSDDELAQIEELVDGLFLQECVAEKWKQESVPLSSYNDETEDNMSDSSAISDQGSEYDDNERVIHTNDQSVSEKPHHERDGAQPCLTPTQFESVKHITPSTPISCDGDATILSADDRDEDSRQQLFSKEEALISSLTTKIKLQENNDIFIAVHTNLLRVIEHAIESIFDPHCPKHNLLPQVTNNVMRVLACNDKLCKTLALYHSQKAQRADDDVFGLDNKQVTWGDIASAAAKKTSNEEVTTDLPDDILNMLANARGAVALHNKKMQLEKFVNAGLATKLFLGSLTGLAIVHSVTAYLTIGTVCSNTTKLIEWREQVEELHKLIHPGKVLSLEQKLSDFIMEVLRPGLSSSDKVSFDTSCKVMFGLVKILNLTTMVPPSLRPVILAGYAASQSTTIGGEANEQSNTNHCAGNEAKHAHARSAMVSQYMSSIAHDVLGRRLGVPDLLQKILCSGQETIRKKVKYEFFDMNAIMSDKKKSEMTKMLSANSHDGTRLLLIDNEEQVNAMQNILEIAQLDERLRAVRERALNDITNAIRDEVKPTKPTTTKPSAIKSTTTKPSAIKSTTTKPTAIESTATKPTAIESTAIKDLKLWKKASNRRRTKTVLIPAATRLGIKVEVTPPNVGAFITEVFEDCPIMDKVDVGDVILSVDGTKVRTLEVLQENTHRERTFVIRSSVEKTVNLLDKNVSAPSADSFPLDVELQQYDIRGNPLDDPMVVRLDKQSHHPLSTTDDATEALVKSMVLALTPQEGADSESIKKCCLLLHFLNRDLVEVMKKRLTNYLPDGLLRRLGLSAEEVLHRAVGLSVRDSTYYLCSLLKGNQQAFFFLLDQLQPEHVLPRGSPCFENKDLSPNELRAALHCSNTTLEYRLVNGYKGVHNTTQDSRVAISEAGTQMTLGEFYSLRLNTERNRLSHWDQLPQNDNEEIGDDELFTFSLGNRYRYEQHKQEYDDVMERMDSPEFLSYCLDSFEALLKKSTRFSANRKNEIVKKYEQRIIDFLEQEGRTVSTTTSAITTTHPTAAQRFIDLLDQEERIVSTTASAITTSTTASTTQTMNEPSADERHTRRQQHAKRPVSGSAETQNNYRPPPQREYTSNSKGWSNPRMDYKSALLSGTGNKSDEGTKK